MVSEALFAMSVDSPPRYTTVGFNLQRCRHIGAMERSMTVSGTRYTCVKAAFSKLLPASSKSGVLKGSSTMMAECRMTISV